MNNSRFISSEQGFLSLQTHLRKIFYLDRSLPDVVFAGADWTFSFLEFDLTLTQRFWHMLKAFVGTYSDSHVSLAMHDPRADAYYHANFGVYGAVRFSRGDKESDYAGALSWTPPGSPADALMYIANVISWSGSSDAWAIWGDREFSIAVAGIRGQGPTWPSVEGIKWFSLDEAISALVSLNFRDQTAPKEIVGKLVLNYGSCADPGAP